MQDPMQGLPEGQPAPQDGPAPLPEPAAPAPAQEPAPVPQEGPPDPARHFQSLYNRTLAEKLETEKRLFDLQMALQTQKPQAAHDPEPDPNTNWTEWIRWQNRQLGRELLEKSSQQQMEMFQRMISTAQEQAWQQKHPQVDLQTVKAFAQVRGIRELDDAYQLMEMQSNMQRVATQSVNSAYQQFKQPQSQAQPLRNAQAAPAPAQLRYDVLADEYTRTHGAVFDTWSKEVQDAFIRESNLREAQRAAGSRSR